MNTLSKEVMKRETRMIIVRLRQIIPIITLKGVRRLSNLSTIESDSIKLFILLSLLSIFLNQMIIYFSFSFNLNSSAFSF